MGHNFTKNCSPRFTNLKIIFERSIIFRQQQYFVRTFRKLVTCSGPISGSLVNAPSRKSHLILANKPLHAKAFTLKSFKELLHKSNLTSLSHLDLSRQLVIYSILSSPSALLPRSNPLSAEKAEAALRKRSTTQSLVS
jgi:hypothetical protein